MVCPVQYGDKDTMLRTKTYLDQFMRVWLGQELKNSNSRRWVSYTKKGMAYQNPLGVEGADPAAYPMQVCEQLIRSSQAALCTAVCRALTTQTKR